MTAQLGRAPRGRWGVARRCHLDVPMAIESHPRLEDASPFPTLFWLTCPILVKRVSTLEAEGWMKDASERLQADAALRNRLASSLDAYRDRRDAHERIPVDSPPGGGPERVKCVHVHLAHQLADPPNPIGVKALADTGWPDCISPCFSANTAST